MKTSLFFLLATLFTFVDISPASTVQTKTKNRKSVSKLTLEQINASFFMLTVMGDFKNAGQLLDQGADVNFRPKNPAEFGFPSAEGSTALMWAIHRKETDSVQSFLKRGSDVHARSSNGYTALLWAVKMECSQAIVQLLIDAQAEIDVDSQFAEGRHKNMYTPLMYATENCVNPNKSKFFLYNLNNLKLLLNAKADLSKVNSEGKTALDIAHACSPPTKASLAVATLLKKEPLRRQIAPQARRTAILDALDEIKTMPSALIMVINEFIADELIEFEQVIDSGDVIKPPTSSGSTAQSKSCVIL